jgi:hypothetical protein
MELKAARNCRIAALCSLIFLSASGCTPFASVRIGGGAASHHTAISPIATAGLGYGGGTYTEALQASADVQVGSDFLMIGGGPELEFHNLRMIQRVDRKLLWNWRVRPEGGFRSVSGSRTGYVGVSSALFAQPWQLLFGVGEQSAVFGAVALNLMAAWAFKPESDAGGFFMTAALTLDWGLGQ